MKNIKLFWNLIQYNDQTLKNLQNEKPKIQKLFLFCLDKNLHYYSEGLDCILVFPKRNNKTIQLIILANGNPDYFKQSQL